MTLVDTFNGFNKLSRLAILWTVCHRWPAGAQFVLNCYHHWALLVVRNPGQDPIFLHSKEGVTQGDPLAMVVYGVALVPLAELIRVADEGVCVPFYANNVAMDSPAASNAHLLIKAHSHEQCQGGCGGSKGSVCSKDGSQHP
eukprot:18040-Ditylum_brightwellii.AAC.1